MMSDQVLVINLYANNCCIRKLAPFLAIYSMHIQKLLEWSTLQLFETFFRHQ